MLTPKRIKELAKCALLFLIGGALYYCIEILWRGYSHWTMAVVGGICFVVIGGLNKLYSVGNAALETGWYWSALCDCYGACGGYPAKSDDGSAYLGLLFPAFQSTGPNLSAIHCAVVLFCAVVHLR